MDRVLEDLNIDQCEECEEWTATGNVANIREHNGTLRTLCLGCTDSVMEAEGWTKIFPSE